MVEQLLATQWAGLGRDNISAAYSIGKRTGQGFDVNYSVGNGENTSAGFEYLSRQAVMNMMVNQANLGESSVDWRGVGEASLSLLGGTAEALVSVGSEWFSAGLSTPVSTVLLIDGTTRMASASVKLMAAFGGMKEARNLPGNFGAAIGMGIDTYAGTKKGKQIGGLVNDAFTVILTGGVGGTVATLVDPAVTFGTKAITVGAQVGAYYDVFNNGGVFK